jgi:hypothetical protein
MLTPTTSLTSGFSLSLFLFYCFFFFFRFFGRFLGKALLEHQQIPANLTPFFFKDLLRGEFTLEDLELFDGEMYKQMNVNIVYFFS